MKSTRDRFPKYAKMESVVVEKIIQSRVFGDEVLDIISVPERSLYDRIIVLPHEKIKLEIQVTEAKDFARYGDIRLDLISTFRDPPGSSFRKRRRIEPMESERFLNGISVSRYGKMYECEAQKLAYYITKPMDLLWIFDILALQKKRQYFINQYGIMVNIKKNESWESCFIPVPEDDCILNTCGKRL